MFSVGWLVLVVKSVCFLGGELQKCKQYLIILIFLGFNAPFLKTINFKQLNERNYALF